MIPRRKNSGLIVVAAIVMGLLFILSLFAQPAHPATWPPSPREVGFGQIKFRGHGPEWWYNRAVQRTREVRAAKAKNRALIRALRERQRIIVAQPNVQTAIAAAAIVYRQSFTDMLRVAQCESLLDPKARNTQPIYNGEHATGLFQFIPSTWASTPFAAFDIYNGWVNALAAGWMWAHSRRNEWACR